jgi:glutaredoxin-related protein
MHYKLFDYISAGIPVITGSLPEIRKAIIKLRDNTDLLNKLKKNSVIASESLNWENESKIVTEFYKTIL